MKKYQKMLILLLISSSIYFIYLFTNKNNLTYIAIGDSLATGQNSYGGNSYGYTNFVKDYLSQNHNLNLYSDYFSSKNKDISTLYNDILKDENIVIDNNSYNLKRLLQESDIITISIGLNDLIYEYSLKNKENLSAYEENRIVDYVYTNYSNLINEIRRYTKRKLYIVGYPTNNVKYQSLIKKLNKKYKDGCTKDNNIFIDSDRLLNSSSYFDQDNNLFPNIKGYQLIATSIISDYKKSKSK